MPIGRAATHQCPGTDAVGAPRGRADPTEGLSRAIINGDAEAFARFYEEWFDHALRAAQSRSRRDESFCLDVTQEVMLRAARAMPVLRSRADAHRWILTLVRSAMVDALRAESRRLRRELRHAERLAARDAPLDAGERIAWLRAQVSLLSDEEQHLLARRFAAGDALDRAGQLSGISAGAAHGRIRRLLARLKQLGEGMLP